MKQHCFHERESCSAHATGTTIMLETIREPTVRAATATTNATAIIKPKFVRPTWTPTARACRSSNDIKKSSRRMRTTYHTARTLIAIMMCVSCALTVKMLPNIKLLKLDEFGTNPERTPARPMPAAITMATANSDCSLKRLRTPSTHNAPARHATTAPTTGLIPAISPPATPARDVWESASPIIESRLSTTVTPISGITAPKSTPTMRPRCMNTYSNMLDPSRMLNIFGKRI